MKADHIVEALTGDSGWKDMIPQVNSSDFPTQWVPSAYECSIIEAQAKEIEKLRAQVSSVVHGRWISFLDGDHIMPEQYYRCSRCGRVESRRQPYCHCGAKMDGGADHEDD